MCGVMQKKPPNQKVSVLRKDLDTLPVLDMCLDLGSPANALLPDGVCEACISMVRIITRFARSCWDAQDLLIERYAPGKACKVEPWKRVTGGAEKTTVDDPLPVVQEPAGETVTGCGETELLTPKKEVQEVNAPEDDQQPVIEPVETTEPPKQPYKPPKTSKSKPASAEPSAKRPRSSEGSAAGADIQPLHGCDFCMQKFATKKLLDQHIRTHVRNLHQAEKKRFLAVDKFHCLRCRAQFSQAEQLKQHFATMHQD